MDYAVQQSINALAFGAEYALLALGLAVVFSIMGLVNFAHGEVIATAGYGVLLLAVLGIGSPLLAVPAAVLIAAAAAVLLERVAFRPVRDAPPSTGLLTAFGVSILLQHCFQLFISPRPLAVPVLSTLDRSLTLGTIRISALHLAELAVTVAAFVAVHLFLTRTLIGSAMRAATRDFETVRLMGIRADRVIAAAFALSGALAGIAALFILARRGSIEHDMGFAPVLKAFVACVIGGFGSLPGAVIGGLILGIVEVALLVTLPAEGAGFREALLFALVAAVLVWRPEGLLGRRADLGDKDA